MTSNKTAPIAAPAVSVFAARQLIKDYLDTHQENLGVTILAESEEDGTKLVGFAADTIESFCGKLSNILTKTGAVGENFAKTFNPLISPFASQFRFVGFVSENGTVQLDGQNIALSLPYTEKSEEGTLVAKVRTARYPLLRGFAGDLSALPTYFISKEKDKEAIVKPDFIYNDNLKPQAVSFWATGANTLDVETLINAIPALASFTALPGFDLSTATTAKVALTSQEEVEAFKAALDSLPEGSAVRSALQGIRLTEKDDAKAQLIKGWATAASQKPIMFELYHMQGELIWALPESMALPEWQRQDV